MAICSSNKLQGQAFCEHCPPPFLDLDLSLGPPGSPDQPSHPHHSGTPKSAGPECGHHTLAHSGGDNESGGGPNTDSSGNSLALAEAPRGVSTTPTPTTTTEGCSADRGAEGVVRSPLDLNNSQGRRCLQEEEGLLARGTAAPAPWLNLGLVVGGEPQQGGRAWGCPADDVDCDAGEGILGRGVCSRQGIGKCTGTASNSPPHTDFSPGEQLALLRTRSVARRVKSWEPQGLCLPPCCAQAAPDLAAQNLCSFFPPGSAALNHRSHLLPLGCQLEPPSLDPELWTVCAGPLLRMAAPGTLAAYFPQGHLEQELGSVEKAQQAADSTPHPGLVLCLVLSITAGVDKDSEEPWVRYRLQALSDKELASALHRAADPGRGIQGHSGCAQQQEKGPPGPQQHCGPPAVWKALSRCDVSGTGGFSIPKKAAEACLPPLDLDQELPGQSIVGTDLWGQAWEFRHVLRGKPRRHLLASNSWKPFFTGKRLKQDDMVVLVRGQAGTIKLGIRRALRATSPVLAEEARDILRRAETGQLEVVYRPWSPQSAPFVVPWEDVQTSLRRELQPGTKFKMAFETADCAVQRLVGVVAGRQSPNLSDVQSLPHRVWRGIRVSWEHSEPSIAKPEAVSPWEVICVPSIAGCGSSQLPETCAGRAPRRSLSDAQGVMQGRAGGASLHWIPCAGVMELSSLGCPPCSDAPQPTRATETTPNNGVSPAFLPPSLKRMGSPLCAPKKRFTYC